MRVSPNTDGKAAINIYYNAALITAGVVGLSMLTCKVLCQKLTTAAKLFVGVATSTVIVNYAQDKGWLPKDIWNYLFYWPSKINC